MGKESILSNKYIFYSVTAVLLALFSCQSPEAPASDSKSTPTLTAPAVPAGLQVVSGNGEASVLWTAADRAASYEVRFMEAASADAFDWASAAATAATVTVTHHQVTGLTNGKVYRLAVVARNSAGASAVSATVELKPVSDLPASPAVTVTSVWSGRLTIGWSAVTGATGYLVYVGTDSSDPLTASPVSVDASTLSYTATGLSDGTNYHFVVRTVAGAKQSAASSPATAQPVSQLGNEAALEGTWAWTETQKTSGTNPVTYTAAVKQTIAAGVFTEVQSNTSYSDGRASDQLFSKGTVAYRAVDQAAVVTITQQSPDGTTWTAVNLVSVYRNLLVDGNWHPDAWVRVGTGTGLTGTWRTIAEQSVANDPNFYLVEYTFPAGASGTADVKGYQVTGATTVSETASKTAAFTWSDPVVTLPDVGLTFTLVRLSDSLYDETDAGSPARTGVPAAPFTLP